MNMRPIEIPHSIVREGPDIFVRLETNGVILWHRTQFLPDSNELEKEFQQHESKMSMR